MRIRQILGRLWARLRDRRSALLAFTLLVLIQIVSLVLPQIPVSPDQSTSYSRWLAELYPQLGKATRPLASLGLLTVRSSYILRLVLAFLGLIVAANADRLREAWHTSPWPRSQTARLLICLGGVLIIGGWAGQILGGWRESEVITWPNTRIVIPTRDLAVDQPSGPLGLWAGGYGHYVLTKGAHVGLEVEGTDAEGRPIELLPAANEEPLDTLRLTFTTQEPEAFFAISEAGLIFRLNQIEQGIQVQAYRSASGELLAETLLQDGDTTAVLQLSAAEVRITQTLLPRYEVIYNPGAAFEGLGMVLLALGAILGPAPTPEDEGDDTEPSESENAISARPEQG